MHDTAIDPTRGFLMRWVVLSAFGLAVGLAAGVSLAGPIEALLGMMLVTPLIAAVAGSVFGASQWLALWRRHRAGLVWIGASAFALGIGMTAGIMLVEKIGRALTGEQVRLFTVSPVVRVASLALVGTITGLAVGAAQRLAMRGYETAPRRWIPRCALAFGVGLPLGGLTADLFTGGLQSAAGFATFLATAGVIVGLLTVRSARRIAPGLPAPS